MGQGSRRAKTRGLVEANQAHTPHHRPTQPPLTTRTTTNNNTKPRLTSSIHTKKRDDAETVYFNESAQAARESVAGVLSQWSELLQSVGDQQRGELQRSMGLKMEQLKAELKELDDLHA